jgi:hypothetical protein
MVGGSLNLSHSSTPNTSEALRSTELVRLHSMSKPIACFQRLRCLLTCRVEQLDDVEAEVFECLRGPSCIIAGVWQFGKLAIAGHSSHNCGGPDGRLYSDCSLRAHLKTCKPGQLMRH